jgi:hypothetical protein
MQVPTRLNVKRAWSINSNVEIKIKAGFNDRDIGRCRILDPITSL